MNTRMISLKGSLRNTALICLCIMKLVIAKIVLSFEEKQLKKRICLRSDLDSRFHGNGVPYFILPYVKEFLSEVTKA
jgi:hypothetical protein